MTPCVAPIDDGSVFSDKTLPTKLVSLPFVRHRLLWDRPIQSYQFLLDVSEFKEDILLDAAANGEDKKGFKGFGSYSAIVNDYIKDGSHSEVNIEFKTKCDILKFAKFKDYASLDLVRERTSLRSHSQCEGATERQSR